MVLFFIFLEVIGTIAFLLGETSSLLSDWFTTSEMTKMGFQIGIMISLFYLYMIFLTKFFLKLYKDMKLTYKSLTLKDKLLKEGYLLTLMSIHYYALSWLEPQVSNLFYFMVLVLFLSFFFGIAIKGIFDELYQIKMSNESKKIIFEER